MHFEYISEAVSHGLMNVQIETGTPVVFGVLTCLTDEQALQRAGISKENPDKNHNHGDVSHAWGGRRQQASDSSLALDPSTLSPLRTGDRPPSSSRTSRPNGRPARSSASEEECHLLFRKLNGLQHLPKRG